MSIKFVLGFVILYSVTVLCEPMLGRSDVVNIGDGLDRNTVDHEYMLSLIKSVVPDLNNKRKGDAGKIAVIGGSTEYTGAPYFAAISALMVGADLVYVITTESAAPIIKAYSPDLIVIPHKLIDLSSFLQKVHVVVLGPGLGREPENLQLAYDTIEICKDLKKPLVIDADGIYAVYKNISLLYGYPIPGAVLTPNLKEATMLKEAIPASNMIWQSYWGDNVSVLQKGATDEYYSAIPFTWTLSGSGSGRRVGGQGDILAGTLGTFFHWAIQKEEGGPYSHLLARKIASYAASKLTRACNAEAFNKYGRSMLASDMIKQIHTCFDNIFL